MLHPNHKQTRLQKIDQFQVNNMYHKLTTVPFYCQGESYNIFIPCYLRMILQDIKAINMERLTASLHGYLQLVINLKDVPKFIADHIMKYIQLEFTNGNTILLFKNRQCLVTHNEHFVTYLYGDEIPMVLNNDSVFMAPFDICTITTTVVISCSALRHQDRKIAIRFNMMDTPEIDDKFRLDLISDSTEFKISRMHLAVDFSSSQFGEEILIETGLTLPQLIDRSRSYHYAMYTISQYRFPGVAIISLFIPLWMFTFANLTVFFQSPQLHDRVSSIATLMIAYVAFIPFLRQRLPLTSSFTFIDINFCILISTCFVCLYQSLKVRNMKVQEFRFEYKESITFIFCACVLLISIIYVITLFLMHKLIWQPQYNLGQKKVEKKHEWMLDTKKWWNNDCDFYFSQYLGYIAPIKNLKI